MDNKVCIIIPVHTSSPTSNELISFKRCFEVLNEFQIFVVTHNEIDLKIYNNFVNSFEIKIVPKKWLSSISEYNKMKINIDFYNLFNNYVYLLTYELDAYVFTNQLDKWVEKKFDYIGAPFVASQNEILNITGVGNSGFSLRNIHKCIYILNKLKFYIKIANYIDKLYLSIFIKTITYFEKYLKIKLFYKLRLVYAYSKNNYLHEDIFWSYYIPNLFSDFVIADTKSAIEFAFEKYPKELFSLNNEILPFGCHAWNKYDSIFWKNHIIF